MEENEPAGRVFLVMVALEGFLSVRIFPPNNGKTSLVHYRTLSFFALRFTYSRRELTRTMPPNWWKEALKLVSDWLLFRDHSPPERQDAGGSLRASRSAGLVLPRVRLCQTQQRNNRFRHHRVFFISLPSAFLFPVLGGGWILIKFTFFITVPSGISNEYGFYKSLRIFQYGNQCMREVCHLNFVVSL
jgi:hypothetical protein